MSPAKHRKKSDIRTSLEKKTGTSGKTAIPVNLREVTEAKHSLLHDRPKALAGIEAAEVGTGKKTYMLRNPENNEYLSIGERDYFVWKLLDGKHTIKDLNIEYINEYASIGITLTDAQVADIKSHADKAEKAGLRESRGVIGSVVSSF